MYYIMRKILLLDDNRLNTFNINRYHDDVIGTNPGYQYGARLVNPYERADKHFGLLTMNKNLQLIEYNDPREYYQMPIHADKYRVNNKKELLLGTEQDADAYNEIMNQRYESVQMKDMMMNTMNNPPEEDVIEQTITNPTENEMTKILMDNVERKQGMTDAQYQAAQQRAVADKQDKMNLVSDLNSQLNKTLKYISGLNTSQAQKKMMRDEVIKEYIMSSKKVIAPSFEGAPQTNDIRRQLMDIGGGGQGDYDPREASNVDMGRQISEKVNAREIAESKNLSSLNLSLSDINGLSSIKKSKKKQQQDISLTPITPIKQLIPRAPTMIPAAPPIFEEAKKSSAIKSKKKGQPIIEEDEGEEKKPVKNIGGLLDQIKTFKTQSLKKSQSEKPRNKATVSKTQETFNEYLTREIQKRNEVMAAMEAADAKEFEEVDAHALSRSSESNIIDMMYKIINTIMENKEQHNDITIKPQTLTAFNNKGNDNKKQAILWILTGHNRDKETSHANFKCIEAVKTHFINSLNSNKTNKEKVIEYLQSKGIENKTRNVNNDRIIQALKS